MSEIKAAQAQQLPQLGPEYVVFQKDVGTWDATVEVRMGPGAAAQVSHGVAVSRLACGGRWLLTDFKNQTTGFEGHGVYGYDPAKQKYTGVWVDNMRTFLAISEGTYDAAAKTMTLWTEAPGPGGITIRWREVTELQDENTQVYRSFMPGPDGSDFEMMTVTYRRRE